MLWKTYGLVRLLYVHKSVCVSSLAVCNHHQPEALLWAGEGRLSSAGGEEKYQLLNVSNPTLAFGKLI